MILIRATMITMEITPLITFAKIFKMIKLSRLKQRSNNYEKNKSIRFEVLNTDVAIDLYNAGNGKTDYCDLYIGSDAIRYTGEQAQALYDAFHARYSEQSKEKTAAKEAELAAKLKQYIGNTK